MARATVLAYHAVTDSWSNDLAVAPEVFARQLGRLARAGYRGVTLREYASGRCVGRTAVITFDDGLRSVLTVAKPVLDELGWPATVFAVTDRIGDDRPLEWLGGDAEPEEPRRHLDWDGLLELARAGWEVGSHSCTHRLLSRLPADERLRELHESRALLERRCGRCTSISYPLGEVDDVVVSAALQAGYTAGAGLAGRFRRGAPMSVPRFAIGGNDGRVRFALKTSPLTVAMRSTPAWNLADAVRRPGRPLGVTGH